MQKVWDPGATFLKFGATFLKFGALSQKIGVTFSKSEIFFREVATNIGKKAQIAEKWLQDPILSACMIIIINCIILISLCY